jgi:HAMP domain-containing protein
LSRYCGAERRSSFRAALYQLATELKDAVDKTNENTLSLEVIKKADEIEKLAKEVRKKMKND